MPLEFVTAVPSAAGHRAAVELALADAEVDDTLTEAEDALTEAGDGLTVLEAVTELAVETELVDEERDEDESTPATKLVPAEVNDPMPILSQQVPGPLPYAPPT